MYGLDKYKRQETIKKIELAKYFLRSNYIIYLGKKTPLIDIVRNAYNNTDRYIAEINHRVESLNNYAQFYNLKNMFITITLPSEYHPKIKNKYKNPKYKGFTPKEASKQLTKMFTALQNTRQYKKLSSTQKCFFRVIEPHKDGTPHLHVSMYIDPNYYDELIQAFKTYFKNNYPKLQYKIVSDIYNPIGYLMKYILKTFGDYQYQKDQTTDLTLWYIYHGISRIYTSRTLISLNIYRALNGKYKLLELTQMYKDREISVLLDHETKNIDCIFHKYETVYTKKKVTTSFKKKSFIDMIYTLKKFRQDSIPIKSYDYTGFDNYIPESTNKFDNLPINPSKLTNYQLLSYYEKLVSSIYPINLDHLIIVTNEYNKRFNYVTI
jgi:hypothetical protein